MLPPDVSVSSCEPSRFLMPSKRESRLAKCELHNAEVVQDPSECGGIAEAFGGVPVAIQGT